MVIEWLAVGGVSLMGAAGVMLWRQRCLRCRQRYENVHQDDLQYKHILDQIPLSIMLLDTQGKPRYLNHAARVFWGIQAEHLSQVMQDYCIFEDEQLINAGVMDDVRRAFNGQMVKLRGLHYDPVHTESLKDKRMLTRAVCGTLNPIMQQDQVQSVLLIHQDVTDLQRSEMALKDSRLKLQAILDYAPVLISMKDLKGNMVLVNRQFEVLQGPAPEAYIGKNIRDLFPGDQAEQFWQNDVQVQQTLEAFECEQQILHRDGRVHTYLTVKFPIVDEAQDLISIGAISTDITEQKLAHGKIIQQAFYDELTRLPNRYLFSDRLNQYLAHSQRTGELAGLILLDIDHFKFINESLGHPIGDALIQHMAQLLSHNVREDDSICRLGSDEFLILITALPHDIEQASHAVLGIVQKLQLLLQVPVNIQGHTLQIDSTVGVVMVDGKTLSATDLIRQADIAMYRAKEKQRGSVNFFQPHMQTAAMQRWHIEQDLRHAIDLGKLFLVYQPVVNAENELKGAECLIRWQPSPGTIIAPDQFIPVAEESGLIVSMGYWIFRTACVQLKEWHQQQMLPNGFRLAVNISPRQFNHTHFVDTITQIMQDLSIDPSSLELEITENLLLSHVDTVLPKMQALRQMGLRFAVDDFGIGYSSLSYLKSLPLARLKIDQSFVRDIETDPDDAAIVETIITMAKLLKLAVTAEGVETIGQLTFLRAHQCDLYQGYYFHKPLKVSEFSQILDKSNRLATVNRRIQ